jgi:hypothetical protein
MLLQMGVGFSAGDGLTLMKASGKLPVAMKFQDNFEKQLFRLQSIPN